MEEKLTKEQFEKLKSVMAKIGDYLDRQKVPTCRFIADIMKEAFDLTPAAASELEYVCVKRYPPP
jgi:hypothetical protein